MPSTRSPSIVSTLKNALFILFFMEFIRQIAASSVKPTTATLRVADSLSIQLNCLGEKSECRKTAKHVKAELTTLTQFPFLYCTLVEINSQQNQTFIAVTENQSPLHESSSVLSLSKLNQNNQQQRQRYLAFKLHQLFAHHHHQSNGLMPVVHYGNQSTTVTPDSDTSAHDIEYAAAVLYGKNATVRWSTTETGAATQLPTILSAINQSLSNYQQHFLAEKKEKESSATDTNNQPSTIFSSISQLLTRFQQYFLAETEKRLSDEEKLQLFVLETAAHDYTPVRHQINLNQNTIDALIDGEKLDQHGQFAKSFVSKLHDLSFFCVAADIHLASKTGTLQGYTVNPKKEGSKTKAAVYDALLFLKQLEADNQQASSPDLVIRIDAHLQSIYGQHPDLFQLLFPALYQHHQQVDLPRLDSCLDQLILSSAQGSGNIDEAAKHTIASNHTRLKRDPTDTWALYYIVDTYKQLAMTNHRLQQLKVAIASMAKGFEMLKTFAKKTSIQPLEYFYFQVAGEYMVYLLLDKQHLTAITVGNEALALLPADYSPQHAATWAFYYQMGRAYLDVKNYLKAEHFLGKAKDQLQSIANRKSSHYDAKELDNIHKYATYRANDVYYKLAEVQRTLEKFETAKQTLADRNVATDQIESQQAQTDAARFEL